MGLEVGTVLTGKITGIKKFGAFVTLQEGRSGLVHISEIANDYVNDVNDHLQEGQEVKVKIIDIDENGRINLSIKKAQAPPPREAAPREMHHRVHSSPAAPENAFEDKLKQFMQDSNNKFSGVEMLTSRKGSRRRSKG